MPILAGTHGLLSMASVPSCPHCGEDDMDGATIELGSILPYVVETNHLRGWLPLFRRGKVDAQGYVTEPAGIVATCPTCRRRMVVAVRDCVITLTPIRTSADLKFLGKEG